MIIIAPSARLSDAIYKGFVCDGYVIAFKIYFEKSGYNTWTDAEFDAIIYTRHLALVRS